MMLKTFKFLVIGSLIFGAGILIGKLYGSKSGSLSLNSLPYDQRFMMAWERDLKRLHAAHGLHPGFQDLKSIEYIATSEKIKAMLKKYPLDLKTSANGRYRLEVLLDELEDGGGLMMQYDLVEIKSGNTIWERGRTFPQKL